MRKNVEVSWPRPDPTSPLQLSYFKSNKSTPVYHEVYVLSSTYNSDFSVKCLCEKILTSQLSATYYLIDLVWRLLLLLPSAYRPVFPEPSQKLGQGIWRRSRKWTCSTFCYFFFWKDRNFKRIFILLVFYKGQLLRVYNIWKYSKK